MAGKIILVTGGARSGKSSFAEKLAADMGCSVGYIATAQIYDEEMRYRVKLHRERRPSAWQTWEAPFEADKIIAEAAREHKVLLFDCITLYLSNH
ncbi:MAG: bifunctional adenosylcobinamide kinase/adenosylcobinamide-phosphate guanylyltransferase, partial [Selenomonas sp.]|nr:bifunctional adenosylcobinamide kinase/adenosylcobinamide-phosphate guanylyltransferase [Selenomonas sp.]